MTGRERILATLAQREPDRVAIDFGGTDCSSLHLRAHENLRQTLGLPATPVRLACLTQQIAETDTALMDRFHGDAVSLYFHPQKWTTWKSGYGFGVKVPSLLRLETRPDGSTVSLDGKGSVRAERPPNGLYFDPVNPVFAGATGPADFDSALGVFDRWDWPAACDETLPQFAARASKLRQSTDRAIVASWCFHYLQAGQIMRGYEQFMVDLLTDEPLARGLLDRLHDVYLQRAMELLMAVGKNIDIVFLTDDLGTQNAPLISPETYRRLIKPYWRELISMIKQQGHKVLMHSCGAVADFIPDLIDMGVDALNPVQITAAGMSPARLKREFGRDIAFWGGGISTQGTLERGTPQEVRDEVRRHLDIFAPGGGYVFTQVHNIQAGVPSANIIAAFDAAAG